MGAVVLLVVEKMLVGVNVVGKTDISGLTVDGSVETGLQVFICL